MPLSFSMFFSMFTKWNVSEIVNGALMNLGLTSLDYIIIVIGVILMITVSLLKDKGSVREMIERKPTIVTFGVYYVLIFTIILLGAYSIGYDASQFIYNQF